MPEGFFTITNTLALAGQDWILLVGAVAVFGIIAQREFQRYQLQRAAIEKGMSILPTGTPIWLASLKKGVLILAVGLGLLVMGTIGLLTFPNPDTLMPTPPAQGGPESRPARDAGRKVSSDGTMPIAAESGPAEGEMPHLPPPPPPQDMGRGGPRGPGRPGGGPEDGPGPFGGPPRGGRFGPPGMRPDDMHDGPPGGRRPDPAMERHRLAVENRRICQWAIGAGGVLFILGAALTMFALFERKYVVPISPGGGPEGPR